MQTYSIPGRLGYAGPCRGERFQNRPSSEHAHGLLNPAEQGGREVHRADGFGLATALVGGEVGSRRDVCITWLRTPRSLPARLREASRQHDLQHLPGHDGRPHRGSRPTPKLSRREVGTDRALRARAPQRPTGAANSRRAGSGTRPSAVGATPCSGPATTWPSPRCVTPSEGGSARRFSPRPAGHCGADQGS